MSVDKVKQEIDDILISFALGLHNLYEYGGVKKTISLEKKGVSDIGDKLRRLQHLSAELYKVAKENEEPACHPKG